MAGDIGVNERLLLATGPVAPGAAAVADLSHPHVRVLHRYGPRVAIAAGPDAGIAAAVQGRADLASPPAAAAAALAPDDLDPIGVLGLRALTLRASNLYAAAKGRRPHAGRPWDDTGMAAPDAAIDVQTSGRPTAAAAVAASPRLTGAVAVGIIIVEGPTAALRFSAAERTKVVAEVQNGLGWLSSRRPDQGITWTYDIQVHTLTTAAGQPSEERWRDPALVRMGYGPGGVAGVTAYVQDLQRAMGTQLGFCAFFTKYALPHFAYASLLGPRVVMNYQNDGWGPENIDRVFAHETGHVFGAPDEYAGSRCDCGGSWGRFGQPNGNCETCAPGGGVPCLMRSNVWELCDWTPLHLGWGRGWESLGGRVVPTPAMAANADGRLEVFAVGTDGGLWQVFQTTPNGGWGPWVRLGGSRMRSPAVGANADGRLALFGAGAQGALRHTAQTAPNNGWSGLVSLGGRIVGTTAVGRNADGRLEIFAVGNDGAMWQKFQTSPNGGWGGWRRLGGSGLRAPAVGVNADGRLEVFAVAGGGRLWHVWQSAPNNGWSGGEFLAGTGLRTPAVGVNADGRLEVFAVAGGGRLWHVWQSVPNNGWSAGELLDGGGMRSPAVGTQPDGRLVVVAIGGDGRLRFRRQAAPNGGWI